MATNVKAKESVKGEESKDILREEIEKARAEGRAEALAEAKEIAKEEELAKSIEVEGAKPKYSEEYLRELVPFFEPRLTKEQPDIFLSVNNDSKDRIVIQPGKHVKIPRYLKMLYDQSQKDKALALEDQEERAERGRQAGEAVGIN